MTPPEAGTPLTAACGLPLLDFHMWEASGNVQSCMPNKVEGFSWCFCLILKTIARKQCDTHSGLTLISLVVMFCSNNWLLQQWLYVDSVWLMCNQRKRPTVSLATSFGRFYTQTPHHFRGKYCTFITLQMTAMSSMRFSNITPKCQLLRINEKDLIFACWQYILDIDLIKELRLGNCLNLWWQF